MRLHIAPLFATIVACGDKGSDTPEPTTTPDCDTAWVCDTGGDTTDSPWTTGGSGSGGSGGSGSGGSGHGGSGGWPDTGFSTLDTGLATIDTATRTTDTGPTAGTPLILPGGSGGSGGTWP